MACEDLDGEAIEKVDDPINDKYYNGILRRIPAKDIERGGPPFGSGWRRVIRNIEWIKDETTSGSCAMTIPKKLYEDRKTEMMISHMFIDPLLETGVK